MTRIHIYLVLLSTVITSVACGRKTDSPYRKYQGAVWATTFHITYNSEKALDDSIRSVLSQVEQSLSPFAPASTVSRINRGETTMTDSMFRHIFSVSCRVNALSRGTFDPTVAPLVNLWGFGYKESDYEPTQQQIDSAMSIIGIRHCLLTDNQLIKPDSRMEFNFSAITKGYACDMIGNMLRRNGCNDYMVEIGGEIAVSGHNDRGHPWLIMIDAPIESDSAVIHEKMSVIAVTDAGIATSGNYRNFRHTRNGKTWHTISPVTGRPAVTATVSATVVAPSAMMADALATACMVMQPDSAMAMISSIPGVSVMLVSAADSSLHVTASPGFPSKH